MKRENNKTITERYNSTNRLLLQELVTKNPKGNLVFSPFSILMLLLIGSESTGGSTREEIAGFLGDKVPYEEIRKQLFMLNKELTSSPVLKSANAVCVRHDIKDTIAPTYITSLKKNLSGELFASRNMISDVNRWVYKKTRGMITEIADDSMRDILASLLNAVAFESKWQQSYEEDDIWDEEFRNADGSISDIPMLHSEEDCFICNDLFTGFTKPYKGVGFSFMALLPRDEDPKAILHAIEDIDFPELYKSQQYCPVEVAIPEFKYSCDCNLDSFMQKNGMTEIFSDHADFSPMSTEWLKFEKVLHKAVIEVDRKGTKAAAVTIAEIGIGGFMPLENPEVILDRPFLFAIVHDETGLPVFTGIVNQIGEGRADNQTEKEDEYICPNCGAILNKQEGFSPDLGTWICQKCRTQLFDETAEGDVFGDVVWYCDSCGAVMNTQEGFTEQEGVWKCTECGHDNSITQGDIIDVSKKLM